MSAKNMLDRLEAIVSELDEMSEDAFFTADVRCNLEMAARYADVALQDAWEIA